MAASTKVKQTPTEKLRKSELLDITRAKNRALSALSFKHITTYEDFLVSIGMQRSTVQCFYPHQAILQNAVKREDIIAYFKTYEVECEQRYAGVYDRFSYEFKPHEYEGVYYDGTNSSLVPVNIVDPDNITADDTLSLEETLPESAKQTCKLFAFQERAAAALYNNIVLKNYRGQLLRAAVGTGKTFIIGAVIRRLLDIQFTEGKTYSPWPIVYVTKASIVQQTERVLQNHFGIDIVSEVKVINIEQLRASFGELMVQWETVVVRGEEQPKWVWRSGVHPLIIFWDESQILKNTGSQQSQIAQAYNEINEPATYQVHFSATPFLRVCEAKCFCVSTRIKILNTELQKEYPCPTKVGLILKRMLRIPLSLKNTAPLQSNASWREWRTTLWMLRVFVHNLMHSTQLISSSFAPKKNTSTTLTRGQDTKKRAKRLKVTN